MPMMTYVRLVILLLSYWGYYRLLCRLTKLERTFIPLFVLSVQGLLIFIAGLLGALLPMAYLIYGGGVAALAVSFFLGKNEARYPVGLWLLMGLMVYAAFLLYRKVVLYNDDFSHWALIVRVMLKNDTFPTAADTLITFPSYPPGTACLLYYVCRVVTGTATCEWGMMMAQAALVFSCLIPLMSIFKKPLWCALPVTLTAAWFALSYDVKLYELMVDSVMPLIAVGCCALIAGRSREDGFWEWALVPPLCLLTLTKNSALVFVLFVWFLYLAWLRPKKAAAWLRSLILLAPMAILLLWRAHTARAIPNAFRTLHSMSGAWFKRILSDKTMMDVLDTISLMKRRTLGESFVGFLLALPLFSSLMLRLLRIRLDPLTRLIPWLNVLCYGLYQFGLLCMYIISMHVTEASHLAQYDRYEGSIVLLLTGWLVIYGFGCARAVRAQRPRAGTAASALLLCAMLGAVLVGKPSVSDLAPADQSDTLRVRMEAILSSCPRGEDYHYLQAISSEDFRADSHYCARYLLWSTHVTTANVYEGVYTEAWYENVWQDYDYLIVTDHYPAVDAFIRNHFPEQAGQTVISLKETY